MSKIHYVKECPGCHKPFKRFRAQKKHVMFCASAPEDIREAAHVSRHAFSTALRNYNVKPLEEAEQAA